MRFRLYQTANYFPPTGPDSFGRPAFGTGQTLSVRWEDKVQETINSNGDTVLSGAVVYLAVPLLVGGFIVLGSVPTGSTDPRKIPGAREVLSIGSVPSLKNTQTLYTAMLR